MCICTVVTCLCIRSGTCGPWPTLVGLHRAETYMRSGCSGAGLEIRPTLPSRAADPERQRTVTGSARHSGLTAVLVVGTTRKMPHIPDLIIGSRPTLYS